MRLGLGPQGGLVAVCHDNVSAGRRFALFGLAPLCQLAAQMPGVNLPWAVTLGGGRSGTRPRIAGGCVRAASGHAAEKRDEVAPFYLIELHSVPASQDRFAGYRIGEEQSAGYTRLFTLGRGPGRRSRFAERRSFAPQ